MPTNGQFIAVWFHNGELWSDTLRWNASAELESFQDMAEEEWVPEDPVFYAHKCATYIIK